MTSRTISAIVVLVLFAATICSAQEPAEPSAAEKSLSSITVLDLKTAGQIALADNLNIAVAMERVQQAKEKMTQAKSLYFPRLDATGGASHVRLSNNRYDAQLATARVFNPAATIDDPEDYYQAGLTAGWILFDGFERKYTNEAARYGSKESEFAEENTRRLVLSSVAETFFTAQLALANIEIAKADEQFNLQQLKDAKARRRAGTGSLSDEYNFQIRANGARTERLKAEADFQSIMFGLAALLGVPDAVFPEHIELAKLQPETEEEMAQPDVDTFIAFAREYRPDVRQGEQAVKRAESEVGIARARFFPTINVGASLDGDRAHNAHMNSDDFGSSVGVNLTYNLFSGGADAARHREAKSVQKEAEKNLDDLLLRTSSDIRGSVTGLMMLQEQLQLQKANTDLSQKNRDLVAKEYDAGQGSLVRLNEAQRDLTTAQSRLVLSMVSLHNAWYKLMAETGKIDTYFTDNTGVTEKDDYAAADF